MANENRLKIRTGNKDFHIETNSQDDVKALLDELHLHQIELELQNRELMESQAKVESLASQYADLYELSPVGYMTLDSRGLVTRINLTAVNMLEIDRAYLQGMPFVTRIHPDYHTIFYSHLRQVLSQGEKAQTELQLFTRSKKAFWVRLESIPEKDEKQNKYCRTAIINITDRKKAELLVYKNEQRLKLALEGANEGLWDWDIESGSVFFNEIWCSIIGEDPEQVKPVILSWKERIHPDDLLEVNTALEKHIEGETPFFEAEHRLRHKDGSWRWILGHGRVVDRNAFGKAFRMIGTIIDITDRKQMQEKLTRSEKMESLGRLAGSVAHDLNNILVGLVTYPDWVLRKLPEDSPLKKHIIKIRDAGEMARDTVEDLLTLTRRGRVDMQPLELNELIESYMSSPHIRDVNRQYPNIRIISDLDRHLLPISGSRHHIYKSLVNLVINAAEAIGRKGMITIRTKNVYIEKLTHKGPIPGEYSILQVEDNGPGIPDDHRDKIYEPFFTSKKIGKSGTGLGLSIVSGTVEDHKGYLDLETELGQGTSFSMYFPATRKFELFKVEKGEFETYMGNGEQILIVDDIEEQRNIATLILQDLGYNVKSVDSGEKAIEYLQSNDVDLILLDMIMHPGIDGLETYRMLKKLNKDQKAVIVTGHAETKRLRKVQKLGAKFVVKKPYNIYQLASVTKEGLAQ